MDSHSPLITIIPLAASLLVVGGLWLGLRNSKPKATSGGTRDRTSKQPSLGKGSMSALTLEQKLEQLAQCGIIMARHFPVQALLKQFDRKDFEEPGYELLLSVLGQAELAAQYMVHGFNFIAQDAECIENDGDYAWLLMLLAMMTQGDMDLTEIKESIDLEGEESSIELLCNGQRQCIEFMQDSDWFSPDVIRWFLELFAGVKSERVFFGIDTGDQSFQLGCLLPAQLQQLQALGIPALPADELWNDIYGADAAGD